MTVMARLHAADELVPGPLGYLPVSGSQDVRTVKLLRLGVGVIGCLLPLALIFFNWIAGDKAVVPSSMSGSYYTSTRNLFVGSLCALGVFLIGYRHTRRQDACTTFAGLCALAVAFAPTAPAPPQTEPAWINYLHHAAAIALIFTLGLFCWVVFAAYAHPATAQPQSGMDRVRSWLRGLRAWLASAWESLERPRRSTIYFSCGFLVFVSGALALYTGIWPTGWSTGWPSLYLFEAVAVFAFGFAWIIAGLEPAVAIQERAAADTERRKGPEDPDTRLTKINLASAYRSAGRTDAAVAIENQIATLGRVRPD
jgi:hypothetical protein